jgi:hypothetical protein
LAGNVLTNRHAPRHFLIIALGGFPIKSTKYLVDLNLFFFAFPAPSNWLGAFFHPKLPAISKNQFLIDLFG